MLVGRLHGYPWQHLAAGILAPVLHHPDCPVHLASPAAARHRHPAQPAQPAMGRRLGIRA